MLGRCGLALPQPTLPDWYLVDVAWLYPNLPFLVLPQPTLPDWYLVDVTWLYPNLPFLTGTW